MSKKAIKMNNLSICEERIRLLNDPSIVLEELKRIKKLGKEKGEAAFKKFGKDFCEKYSLSEYEPTADFSEEEYYGTKSECEKLIPTDLRSTIVALKFIGPNSSYKNIDSYIKDLQQVIKNRKLSQNKKAYPKCVLWDIYDLYSDHEVFEDEVQKGSKTKIAAYKKLEDTLYKENNRTAIENKLLHSNIKGFTLTDKEYLEVLNKAVFENGQIWLIMYTARCFKNKYSEKLLPYYLLYLALNKNESDMDRLEIKEMREFVADMLEKGKGVKKSPKLAEMFRKK